MLCFLHFIFVAYYLFLLKSDHTRQEKFRLDHKLENQVRPSEEKEHKCIFLTKIIRHVVIQSILIGGHSK